MARKILEIHISVKEVNDEHIFSIKDNGIGIDQKHLDRIFTIFHRLHSKDEYEGTGIGLAISEKILQKIVEKFGLNPNLEKEQHSTSHYPIQTIKLIFTI